MGPRVTQPMTLIDHVRSHVDPRDYYSETIPDVDWSQGEDPRVCCIFHDDSTPSLHVNAHTGKWYCHGCEAGGKSIVSFQSWLDESSHDDAAAVIFHKFLHPTIDPKKVRAWHRKLLKTPTALRYLKNKRRVSQAVIEQFKIGFDGERFILPVANEFGLYVNAKLYDPKPKGNMPKMLNYSLPDEDRKFGRPPQIYPIQIVQAVQKTGDEETVIMVVEGEWDALALISIGIAAVSSTAGAKSWPPDTDELFNRTTVCVCYDNDKEGETYYVVPIKALRKVVRAISRIKVPKKYGKDVTDWMTNCEPMRKKDAWLKKISGSTSILENPDSIIPTTDTSDVSLQDSSAAHWFQQPVRVQALITGKDASPYLVPKSYRISCAKTCETCPLKELDSEYRSAKVDPGDPIILRLIDVPEDSQRKLLLSLAGFGSCSPKCRAKIEVLETQNVEQLLLIPTLDSSSGEYAIRPAYYTGHGIATNRAYSFTGKPLAHPRDQHATCLFNGAVPVQDAIETFELSSGLARKLRRFRPRGMKLMTHLTRMAEWQAHHITHIRQRPDLHIAADLVFHSVNSFHFNGEHIRRGMLDVLILGDTRCGKGYVTEGLIRYYGLGEIASGENCSFAGLVGGLQQSGNRWFVTWGLIPLNHNRIVVIDEASALSTRDIGRMSRVRSEGVAEISKIVREVTRANTRLIWCANPRSGHPLATYNSGAEAIKELVGANEDISRFDYALTVATQEVASEIINTVSINGVTPGVADADRYPPDLCKALVLWTWSRTPDQIKFTDASTAKIIELAIEMGGRYSPTIPLVQAENIRVKLAKIAAAIAARTFSTDATGERLIIRTQHVDCAAKVLDMFYTKESMRYDDFSDAAFRASTMENESDVLTAIDSCADPKYLVEGLLALQEVSADGVADYVGDMGLARMIISELVKLRCLSRQGSNRYVKNPAFVDWLRSQEGAVK